MRIEVDTNHDSKEEIIAAIRLLQSVLGKRNELENNQYSGNLNNSHTNNNNNNNNNSALMQPENHPIDIQKLISENEFADVDHMTRENIRQTPTSDNLHFADNEKPDFLAAFNNYALEKKKPKIQDGYINFFETEKISNKEINSQNNAQPANQAIINEQQNNFADFFSNTESPINPNLQSVQKADDLSLSSSEVKSKEDKEKSFFKEFEDESDKKKKKIKIIPY